MRQPQPLLAGGAPPPRDRPCHQQIPKASLPRPLRAPAAAWMQASGPWLQQQRVRRRPPRGAGRLSQAARGVNSWLSGFPTRGPDRDA